MKTELCEIMKRNGSDKGGGWHNYTEYYYEIFSPLRDKEMDIFELGLGTNNVDVPSNMGAHGVPGASHRGWREFFKNSNIYGADIDTRILFNEERIRSYHCDQTNHESIRTLFEVYLNGMQFDIIIEDGLHTFFANETFLRNSFKYLKSGGIFIVEDLSSETVHEFKKIEAELIQSLEIETFEILEIYNPVNSHDNKLLVIKKK